MNVIASLIFCLLCAQISALDFYVSPDGSNSNSGNRSSPFQTLNFAYQAIPASDPKQFNNIWIESGVYDVGTNLVLLKTANVEFAAVPGSNVVLTCGVWGYSYFYWDSGYPLDDLWYTTTLQGGGITFTNCSNAFQITPQIGRLKKGGMHFQFQNFVATAALFFNCAIWGGNPGQTTCTLSFTGCKFEKSEGNLMFGIMANTVTSVSVNSCTFSGCTAAVNVSNAASVTINDVTVTQSIIPLVWTPSALIFASNVNEVIITDLTVVNNTGGITGLSLSNCALVSVNSAVFDSNRMWYTTNIDLSPNVFLSAITIRDSHSYVCLMQLTDSWVFLNNSLIEGNSGSSAIAVASGASLFMTNSQLSSNSAPSSGGGVWLADGTFLADGCVFKGNKAKGFGGALYAEQGKVVLLDSTFIGNSAASGGASWCATGFVEYQASECTFTNNTSRDNPVQCGNSNSPMAMAAPFVL